MVYKRYIKIRGKRHGPYYYESYRDKNGRVVSRYLPDYKPKSSFDSKSVLVLFFAGLIIIILMFLVFFPLGNFYFNVSERNFGVTGFVSSVENFLSFNWLFKEGLGISAYGDENPSETLPDNFICSRSCNWYKNIQGIECGENLPDCNNRYTLSCPCPNEKPVCKILDSGETTCVSGCNPKWICTDSSRCENMNGKWTKRIICYDEEKCSSRDSENIKTDTVSCFPEIQNLEDQCIGALNIDLNGDLVCKNWEEWSGCYYSDLLNNLVSSRFSGVQTRICGEDKSKIERRCCDVQVPVVVKKIQENCVGVYRNNVLVSKLRLTGNSVLDINVNLDGRDNPNSC
jgi:hypothetical protein